MSKHTPTPWRQGELLYSPKIKGSPEQNEALDRQEKLRVFSNFKNKDKGKTRRLVAICQIPEDAQRIVACVNACEGMKNPVEHIEQLRGLYEDLHAVQDASRKTNERNVMLERQRDQLQAERDELLEVLKDLMDHTTMEFAEYNGFGPQRNKVSQVYDRIKWGVPNTGGGAS